MLLGPAGHKEFAIAIVAQRQAIGAYCATWAVEETSLYVHEVMRWAVQDCHERMQRDVTWHQYLLTVLLPWTGWLLQDFKAAVGATILHLVVAETPAIQESLTRFVLSDLRLRDPRLPRNTTNWLVVLGRSIHTDGTMVS